MRLIKKGITFMLIALMLIAMVGCTNTDVADDTADTNEGVAEANGETDNDVQEEAVDSQEVDSNQPVEVEEAEPEVVYGTPGSVDTYSVDNSHYQLTVNASEPVHEISDLLYGIFFEDINFAADGGLYAEMVQNRSFEFTDLAAGNEMHAWTLVGDIEAKVTVDDLEGSLNRNNTNYLVMTNGSSDLAGVENRGFLDGMALIADDTYKASLYAKGIDGYTGPLTLSIEVDGQAVATQTIDAITDQWQSYQVDLSPSETANSKVTLRVAIEQGTCAIDMVSLFPEKTYQDRVNGMRLDLSEHLEALEPNFLRFPGGCVVEGVTLSLAYDWKDSIGVDENRDPLLFNGTYGDVAARRQGQNIWTNEGSHNDQNPSFMTYGLGFYEYFLLSEDIGAIGVPILNVGMCCQAQGNGTGPNVGSDNFERYIDDALDLVEFCRGGQDTTWGAVRIAMGHEAPFDLKYVGIGNEQWGNSFFYRYEAFVQAFKQAAIDNPDMYGDIELMFTAGPDDGDSGYNMYIDAYDEVADWLDDNPDYTIEDFAGAIDHHYYNDPEWFLKHVDYYDEANYTRDVEEMTDSPYGGGIPVFVGEYAARSNTLKAALAEAAYMTGLEKNGDIVVMAAYAPLFGNTTATHWSPDLIWFNNHLSTPSVNYYVQQIFAKNAGTGLLESELTGAELGTSGLSGKVGVATWETSAIFDNILVTDNETGEVLAQQTFDQDTLNEWQQVSDGQWSIEEGQLVQSSTSTNTGRYGNTGSAMYFGDASWTNYTYTLEATQTGGREGFLIPIAVGDQNNNIFWNIGGWGNTVSCLQTVSDGVKSGQVGGTVSNCSVKTNQTYEIKIVVNDKRIQCYMDDKLYIDYEVVPGTNAESYEVVSVDDNGDILVKLVNVTAYDRTFAIDLQGASIGSETAMVDVVAGSNLANDNVLGKDPVVILESSTLEGISNQFNYTTPKYSVTVIRIKGQ